jgi:hypothetical protein
MRKHGTSILGMAVVLVVAIAASAAIADPTVVGKDGNTQSIDVRISPKQLSKTTFTPATLKVTTKTTSTTAPNGVPSPANRAVVDFDRNAKLFTKGLPTCDAGKLQSTSTEAAEFACGKAKIGSGSGAALLPVGTNVFNEPTVVTAFNGVPKGGKPVVLLHAYGKAPVQTTLILVGVISNYNKEGFGPRLDVEIPKIAGGTGALTDFSVRINKKFKFKGKQRSFISAKCPNSKKLKARGTFTFADGESLTAFSTQSCNQRK